MIKAGFFIAVKARLFLGILPLIALACWLTAVPTPVVSNRRPSPSPALTATRPLATRIPTITPNANLSITPTTSPGELAPLDFDSPFYSALPETVWQPPARSAADMTLPVEWDQVENPQVVAGLSNTQRNLLRQNGFLVLHTQEPDFSLIRQLASSETGQPYYLSTDAAYHALRQELAHLIPALEREALYPRMLSLTQAILDEILDYLPLAKGTTMEEDAQLSADFMAVGLKLLDPEAEIDPQLSGRVATQVEQILAARGVEDSILIPGYRDDFSLYQPTGHYSQDPTLESYFRAMTWFGRARFKLNDSDANFVPMRVPLILTIALRRAESEQGEAAQDWMAVHETLTFLMGPSAESSPLELAALMDPIYGRRATFIDLSDEALWRRFLALAQGMPSPNLQPNFTTAFSGFDQPQAWRFMGQHFNLDDLILGNLDFPGGLQFNQDKLPSGLEFMTALGSEAAALALSDNDVGRTPVNSGQMVGMQQSIQSFTSEQWLSTFQTAWMHASLPLLQGKSDSFPAFMRTPAWAYKDLNSILGGWIELKHDNLVPENITQTLSANSQLISPPAPGYVEPNPLPFYRLAHLSDAIVQGSRALEIGEDAGDQASELDATLTELEHLAAHLQQIGDIAAQELAGEPLDEEDYRIIQNSLSAQNELSQTGSKQATTSQSPGELPVITAVASNSKRTLEAGTGFIDRIYVIVPLDGKLHIAQGGVFSYYEFSQPRDEPVADAAWRRLLLSDSPPKLPEWSAYYLLPGGNPLDALAFRIGDVYRLTSYAGSLALRQEPSRNASRVREIIPGDILVIVDGPVETDGTLWWKFKADPLSANPSEGWALANQSWYERLWR